MNGLPPLEPAPEWSLATGQIGHALIFVALVLYLITIVGYLYGEKGWSAKIAKASFVGGSLAFFGTAICLFVLFIKNQWHFEYVFGHSATDHEFQYLFAGLWSGQEGSFLLWAMMASVVGVIAARGTAKFRRWFTVVYAVFLAALAGILIRETPFVLKTTLGEINLIVDGQLMMLPEGVGLPPTLLNYWMVIHPPTIFLGFGALTVLFAYAIAALAHRDTVSWIPFVRPWALFTLAILGIGLCMGGFWAYETLGWGGFWAWDPVENTSFVPWCLVVVFVHGMFVQQAKKKWYFANLLFAMLPFLFFCYGTLLTRSGSLSEVSVHSFAEMDSNALQLLKYLNIAAVLTVVAAFVLNWREIKKPELSSQKKALPLNRLTLYGFGSWLLFAFAFITSLGMSYPFFMGLAGESAAVIEEHLYHSVLAWFYPPLMIAMAIAPFVGWNGARFRDVLNRILNCVAISIGLIGCILLWLKSANFPAPEATETIHFWSIPIGQKIYHIEAMKVSWVLFLTWCSLFTAIAAFWRMMELWKKSKSSVGGLLTHFGLALTLLGLVFSRGFQREVDVTLHNTANPTALGMSFVNEGPTLGLNNRKNKLEMSVEGSGQKFTAWPGIYARPARGDELSWTSWPYIQRFPLFDYYIAIGQPYIDPTDSAVIPFDEEKKLPVVYRDTAFTYEDLEVYGDMGTSDSLLVAHMNVIMGENVYEIKPAMQITESGEVIHIPEEVADTYRVFLLGVDLETKDITFNFEFIEPAYPMKVFYKPLTLFVWLGVGIMTLGGLIAAANRRREKRAAEKTLSAKVDAT